MRFGKPSIAASNEELQNLDPNKQDEIIRSDQDMKPLKKVAPDGGPALRRFAEVVKQQEQSKTASPAFVFVILLFLVMQNSAGMLLMRFARTEESQSKWNTQTAVILMEVIKAVVSVVLLAREGTLRESFSDWPEVARSCVPAVLYLIQNNLVLVASGNLAAPTFAILYQVKVLMIALLSVLMLGKVLTRVQWASMIVLFGGVACVAAAQAKPSRSEHGNFLVGVAAVTTCCFLSSSAGVYFEKILNGSAVSLWARNLHLSVFSVAVGLGWLPFTDVMEKGFFYGYSWSAGAVIINNAVGGLLCALAIKHAGNIVRNFSQSCAIVVTAVLSTFLFGTVLSGQFVCGAFLVVVAVFAYGSGDSVLAMLQRPQARAVPQL